jgi:hypothetical protein
VLDVALMIVGEVVNEKVVERERFLHGPLDRLLSAGLRDDSRPTSRSSPGGRFRGI